MQISVWTRFSPNLFAKSAVFKSFTVDVSCALCFSRPVSTTQVKYLMKMSWEQEKRQYLSMTGEQKRKDSINWLNIPTWAEFASGKELPEKIDILPGNSIDNSKNEALADKIAIFYKDITTLEVDAIVNAANESLLGGGGVDGAIHGAAGPTLKQECKTLGGCKTGEAKITGGYKLPAKYVIHTVGPRGENPDFLRNCYANSLKLAVSNNLRTVAFPCISTGIYGYPNLSAAHVASYTIRKYLEENGDKLDRVFFCLFLDIDKDIYGGVLQSYFPYK